MMTPPLQDHRRRQKLRPEERHVARARSIEIEISDDVAVPDESDFRRIESTRRNGANIDRDEGTGE